MTTFNSFICFDLRDGLFTYEERPDFERGVSFDVHHGLVCMWGLPQGREYNDTDEIVAWVRENAGKLLDELRAEGEEAWDGSNWYWKFENESQREYARNIEDNIEQIIADCPLGVTEWEASDWYLGGLSWDQVVSDLGLTPEHTACDVATIIEEDTRDATGCEGEDIVIIGIYDFAEDLVQHIADNQDDEDEVKKMPEGQKRQIRVMNSGEVADFQIRLQVECGMTDQEAADYIAQAFTDED